MKDFKADYCNYVEQLELSYEKPDTMEMYRKCKQYNSEHTFLRKKYMGVAVAAAVAVVMLGVAIKTDLVTYAYDAITNILVQYNILEPQKADTSDIIIGQEVFEKTFSSISEVAESYKLEIMESEFAYNWQDEYTVAIGYGEGEKVNAIRIISPYYIMGDLPVKEELLHEPDESALINPFNHGIYGDEDYADDLYQDFEYQTPVYLSMYINVSGEKMEWTSVYEETDGELMEYISNTNGMKCVIVSKEFKIDDIGGLNPMVKVYGVKNNVEYRLEGRVSVETMKGIIDSFK